MTRIAILNSRQSKTPVANDEWVRNTLAAADHAVTANKWDVVSSIGMLTWDLVTWRASVLGAGLDLIVPKSAKDQEDEIKARIVSGFGLGAEQVRWHFFVVEPSEMDTKKWWERRDQMVLQIADLAFPVSMRSNGQLERLLYRTKDLTQIDWRFSTPYAPRAHHLSALIDERRLNPAILNWPEGWLVHWTRTRHGPWPGETPAAFFEDFTRSEGEYCRSGLRTLVRILREERIRGSAWKTGGKQPMVAFTELSPAESVPLMRWRARWSNWAFEPYGIAVNKDFAVQAGARIVRYVPAPDWVNIDPKEKPFTHSAGRTDPIWPAEREWRIAGDFDLTGIPRHALRVIVRETAEREALRDFTGAEVYAFMR